MSDSYETNTIILLAESRNMACLFLCGKDEPFVL